MTQAAENHEINAEHPKRSAPPGVRARTAEYFSRLRLRVKLGFLAVFLIPPIALFAYFHFQFNSTLKESGKLHLASLAESQKNTIDLFLQERVVNIFSLFHSVEFDVNPSQDAMDRYLQTLRQTSDAFIDVGFCDSQGTQIGYAGPFTNLLGKDYGSEDWFVAVMEQDEDYYISDIYLGFRNDPHFTIAVKQRIDAKPYVMRATLDPDKFYMFLRSIGRGKGVDSALINKEGRYQVVDPDRGELLGDSEYMPPESEGYGVEETRINANSILAAYVWLEETPWVLVIRQPLSVAYAQMYRTRKIMIATTVLIIVGAAISIWIITDRLLRRAQATARSREELQSQLVHASKLASLGELAAGIAHEINNPLAIIAATTGVVRDMFDPEFNVQWTPETIKEELANIDTAVFKARGITQTLLKFSRKDPPRLVPVNVNKILEQVVAGLKEHEFELSDIELVRDYDPNLPDIMLDPDQIGQVFLNLINNAGDAIEGSGTITLTTHHDDGFVRVTVGDNGVGMTPEIMEKIFSPFYTTKEVGKGTGLGLSVSSSIVEAMGGRIEAQSVHGAGSSFTVVLPLAESEHVENGSS
ncbi:MAG: histidine kinase [Planctomycetes bacterium]|nr:histidine kinase [Planctomycetota bacterium]MBL7039128.1 histidine kinase [Pirellulaceae bacterium]